MKGLICHTVGVLFATVFFVFAARTAVAQDPVKVAPNVYKVLLENDRVRVLEVLAKAGEKIPMHWHPAYVVYVLSSGKVKFVSPDTTVIVELKAGEVSWHEAEKHAPENIGTTDIHALAIEMKGLQEKPKESEEPPKTPKK